jgi:hypothetical protein
MLSYPWSMRSTFAKSLLGAVIAAVLSVVSMTRAEAAQPTYRCPKADGSIEYTNTPCADGEVVRLPELNAFRGQPVPEATPPAASEAAEPVEFPGYEVFEISDPTPEKTYVNIGGELNLSIRISPRLQEGHGIMLYLDGQPVSLRPQNRTSFHLTEVWPVVHTVRAEVVSVVDGVVATTPDVQFYVRQRTIN